MLDICDEMSISHQALGAVLAISNFIKSRLVIVTLVESTSYIVRLPETICIIF